MAAGEESANCSRIRAVPAAAGSAPCPSTAQTLTATVPGEAPRAARGSANATTFPAAPHRVPSALKPAGGDRGVESSLATAVGAGSTIRQPVTDCEEPMDTSMPFSAIPAERSGGPYGLHAAIEVNTCGE